MKTTVKLMIAETLIALLLLVVNTNAEATETKNSSHEIFETELQLEDWMIDKNVRSTNSSYITDYSVETDATLELQDWMTSNNMWNINITEEIEAELKVENWMTNVETWDAEDLNLEPVLTLEKWMLVSK